MGNALTILSMSNAEWVKIYFIINFPNSSPVKYVFFDTQLFQSFHDQLWRQCSAFFVLIFIARG